MAESHGKEGGVLSNLFSTLPHTTYEQLVLHTLTLTPHFPLALPCSCVFYVVIANREESEDAERATERNFFASLMMYASAGVVRWFLPTRLCPLSPPALLSPRFHPLSSCSTDPL